MSEAFFQTFRSKHDHCTVKIMAKKLLSDTKKCWNDFNRNIKPWLLGSFIQFPRLLGLTFHHILFCWTLTQLTIKVLMEGNVLKSVANYCTLFESENERQKIEPVPIPLPRASRNCPDIKTRNNFFFHNWTSEIIPFIRFGMQMDRT